MDDFVTSPTGHEQSLGHRISSRVVVEGEVGGDHTYDALAVRRSQLDVELRFPIPHRADPAESIAQLLEEVGRGSV